MQVRVRTVIFRPQSHLTTWLFFVQVMEAGIQFPLQGMAVAWEGTVCLGNVCVRVHSRARELFVFKACVFILPSSKYSKRNCVLPRYIQSYSLPYFPRHRGRRSQSRHAASPWSPRDGSQVRIRLMPLFSCATPNCQQAGVFLPTNACALLHSAIEKAGMEYRRELLSNIILVGVSCDRYPKTLGMRS